jgi:hypothetical protein
MDRLELTASFSPWFYPLCLLVGGLYAFVLYQKKPVWSKTFNYLLATFRFLLVSLLCFLLLGPLIRQLSTVREKPALVLALDNSASMRMTHDSLRLPQFLDRLSQLNEALKDKGIETEVQVLSTQETPKLSNLAFNEKTSDLSGLLNRIQNNYVNRNLAGVILVSDGIFNQGISPDYVPYPFPLYTVGMGDTIPKKDINLKAIYYNKISYVGNKFPVNLELQHNGFAGTRVQVVLRLNDQVAGQQQLTLGKDGSIQALSFQVLAAKKGIQRLSVLVSPVQGEFTLQNNSREAFIEVIEGKEKVLLLALAPHPDIKALKYAIEKNENYEFEYHIAGLGTKPKHPRYDLVILHQIPDLYNTGQPMAQPYLANDTPVWYILGSQSNTGQAGTGSNLVRINAAINQTDQVTPLVNPGFNLFQLDPEKNALFLKFPPVTVPFGDFKLAPGSEVILYQKVGSVQTEKPLLVVSRDSQRKTAVMMGEGMWEWRQEEYNLTEKHEAFDELVLKLVQYLSAKEDKRKLRVSPTSEEFLDSEQVVFEVETYNDIYEQTYDQDITLVLTNDKGQNTPYQFKNSQGSSRFEISRLPKGIYRYKATATLGKRLESSAGEFTVKDVQLEALQTTADHQLLRNLSKKTNGGFFLPDQLDRLQARLLESPPKDLVRSEEKTREIIHTEWIFFLLLGLATLEWGIRKYLGES